MEISVGVKHALESGSCVLFVGAGVGAHMKDANGRKAPDGPTLAAELAEAFSIEHK